MDKPTEEKLVSIFYILMRDDITFGAIEDIMRNHVVWNKDEIVYSNKFIEQYARSLVNRLQQDKDPHQEITSFI